MNENQNATYKLKTKNCYNFEKVATVAKMDKCTLIIAPYKSWPCKGLMHLSIACPRVPPPPPRGDGGDLTRVGGGGGGQTYPKSPPGDRRNGQTSPPCTRGDHSADWRRSLCPGPTPVTHLVVKFPPPWAKRSGQIPRGLRGGGGGRGLAIDRCITPSVKKMRNFEVLRYQFSLLSGRHWEPDEFCLKNDQLGREAQCNETDWSFLFDCQRRCNKSIRPNSPSKLFFYWTRPWNSEYFFQLNRRVQ